MAFTYAVVRPIPYPWFAWVVYLGGALLIVLISILNLANNGYNLTNQYTTLPNDTATHRPWAQRLAAIDNKNAAKCEAQSLPVNSQYYTQNQALAYTIDNVWQVQKDGTNLSLPSLRYLNNAIEDCSVALIQLNYESNDRSAAEIGFYPWSVNALGIVTCAIYNQEMTYVNLTIQYNYIPPTIESGNPFRFLQAPNQTTSPSLWWGESLLSWYWLNAAAAMRNESLEYGSDGNYTITKGSIAFRPRLAANPDLGDPDFWVPKYHFIFTVTDDTGTTSGPQCCINPANNPPTIQGLHDDGLYPNIWIEADSLAKVFYSAILTDLGQTSTVTILNDATLLTAYSNNITNMVNVETPWLTAGPAKGPYASSSGSNLTLTPSFFYTEYLCQVPKLKSTGSLIISLLVADLVFLQAAWVVLNWITMRHLERTRPAAYSCAGCMGSSDAVELIQTGTSRKSTGYAPLN